MSGGSGVTRMQQLLASEWYKLRKNGTFLSLCASMALLSIVLPAIIYWTRASQEGIRIGSTVIELFGNAIMINQLYLKISVGILAAFFIASEYRDGVLKRTMSAGIERHAVYLSKLLVYACAVIAAALILPVLVLLIGSLMNAFGLLSGYGQLEGTAMAGYYLRTTAFTMLFAAAYASIAAWFAALSADSGKTVGISILFFLFADQILAAISSHFPVAAKLYDYSIFRLFSAVMSAAMERQDMLPAIAMPLLTIVVFAALGVRTVLRQEIQ